MKRHLHQSVDAAAGAIHILAAVLAALALTGPFDGRGGSIFGALVVAAGIGLVDLVLTWPLRRWSRALRPETADRS